MSLTRSNARMIDDVISATDLAVVTAQLDALESTVDDIAIVADGGINTFYQDTEPAAEASSLGDLWIDTDDDKMYRHNGTAWVFFQDDDIQQALVDAASAANIADNKITTYYSDTVPTLDLIDGTPLDEKDVGDLWVDTDDHNKLYRFSQISEGIYVWVSIQDTTVADNIYVDGTTYIDGVKISDGTITADKIEANTITANEIEANTITANEIVAGTITADEIATRTLTAEHIESNTITANEIEAFAITATQIDANAITAGKIAAGAIASETSFVSGVIEGRAIATDTVVSSSFQSPNFDGQVTGTGEDRVLTTGTKGFYLDGESGTAVLNTLIARDGIIAGNYIQYSEDGAFAVKGDGSLGLEVDDETLQITAGGIAIKNIPSTSVVINTEDVNYTGGHDEFALDDMVSAGNFDYLNSIVPVFTWNNSDNFEAPSNITSVDLYNMTFKVDYSAVDNLANATYLAIKIYYERSDAAGEPLNSPAKADTLLAQIINPVLPAGVVEYTLVQEDYLGPFSATNTYLNVYLGIDLTGTDGGTISTSVKQSLNTQLQIAGTGEITSPTNAFDDLYGIGDARPLDYTGV